MDKRCGCPIKSGAAIYALMSTRPTLGERRQHRCNAKDGSGDDLSIRGRGCRHHGCPGPKNANASGSRRRMRRGLPDPLLIVSNGTPGLPRDRGMLPALGASALSRPRAAQPAEQDARGSVAGVQGARCCLLPGRLAGARPMLRDDIAAAVRLNIPCQRHSFSGSF